MTVYTKDGKEIQGTLNYAGKEEVEKEIIISNPILIIRDSEHKNTEQRELGKEMLFTNNNISRIAFWEHF